MIGEDDEISRKRGREPRREDEPCVPAAISANSRSRIGGQPDATAAPFPTREQLKAMLEFATRRRDLNKRPGDEEALDRVGAYGYSSRV